MDEGFLQSLRATFKVEAAEHLHAIGTGLLELEKTAAPAAQAAIIETVFRAAHSLKGAARAINLTDIEALCQSLEELFAAWKRRDALPNRSTLDSAHHILDTMTRAMAVAQDTLPGSQPPQAASTPAVRQHAQAAHARPSTAALGVETETVRMAVSALDERLLEAEEMLAAKSAGDQRAIELGVLAGRFAEWRKEWARVQSRARSLRLAQQPEFAGALPDSGLVDFLDWNHNYLRLWKKK